MWAARAAVILALCVGSAAGGDFDRTIRPLLSERCGSCHSDEEKSSEYSVAGLPSVIAGGEKFGTAVIPGHPEQSPLVQVLRGLKKPRMPLRGKLPEEDIARIEEWIRTLSPADAKSAPAINVTEWAYRKPARPEPPSVRHGDWVRNPIDAFVMQKLESAGLEPAPPTRASA